MEDIRHGTKVRFALIGCGAISDKHVKAISMIPDAQIVGAYDLNAKAASDFQAKTGVPCFTDLETMVRNTDPHILTVLTPSGSHASTVLDLMRFNRHFVVEKPLALRLDHIDKILENCDKRGLKIFVVKQNRFNPPVQQLRHALERDRFGKLVMGTVRVRWCRPQAYYDEKKWRGTWAFDGGVLTNQASHHIDLLIWMMGEVESVTAKTATRLANIEAEDTGVAILKFRNGALGIVEA
nr:Gfo/Idh/MocA family oxidoreductase [Fibrobacterota bacterium]